MPDTDHKRMLEMAAKAMGWTQAEFQDMRGWGEVRHGFSEAMWVPEIGEYWNPLSDDGDALRLAADLRLSCMTHENFDASASSLDGRAYGEAAADVPAARHAALRSAIVRAAAAIGEQMP